MSRSTCSSERAKKSTCTAGSRGCSRSAGRGSESDLSASQSYTQQACAAGLFRPWATADEGFGDALAAYLTEVHVDARWVSREGLVQAAWMVIEEPWVTLDREAVIGRVTSAARVHALAAPAVRAAYAAVDRLSDDNGWPRPAPPKGANELDQLAVDPSGRLVLVELKEARAPEVVTAPLQSLRYVWEWRTELPSLLPSLNALLDARRRLGLVPPGTPSLDGRLRAAIGWGSGSPSAEVLRRMLDVKAVADAHLPDAVDEIEVWALEGGRSFRVDGRWRRGTASD